MLDAKHVTKAENTTFELSKLARELKRTQKRKREDIEEEEEEEEEDGKAYGPGVNEFI